MRTPKREFITVTLILLAGVFLSPAAVFAAEERGDKWGAWLSIGRVFNLAVVIGVLVWLARKPLANFYASRSEFIKEQLAEAQKARLEAESKLAEMESRMSHLTDELQSLKAEAERVARMEYERLVAEAEQDASKVIERARQEISGMTRAAQIELRAHAAELAMKLAEDKIRGEITDADRNRLFADFIGGLERKT